MHPEATDIDGLIRDHGGFVRRLARRLVHDAAQADEVVQRTWETAWRHHGAAVRETRSWLAGVVKNLSARLARSEATRSRHEQAAAAEHDTEVPGDADRDLVLREVMAAILDLAEPYKTTLLMRYYQDLEPSEIARREDIPAGTVRSRLKRGLEMMRERLDHRHASRLSWCLPLAFFAFPDGPSVAGEATTASAPGAGASWLAGSGVKRTLAAVACVGIATLAVVLVVSGPEGATGAHEREEVAAREVREPTPRRTRDGVETDDASSRRGGEAAGEPARAPVRPVVTGVVTDPGGVPLRDVTVSLHAELTRWDEASLERDAERWRSDPVLAEARPDESGRFELAAPGGGPWYVIGRAAGRATVLRGALGVGADVRVVLAEAPPWSGVVVDSDGAPLADALVSLRRRQDTGLLPDPSCVEVVRTRSDGTFAVEAHAASWDLAVRSAGHLDRRVARGSTFPLRVTMERGRRLEIRLVADGELPPDGVALLLTSVDGSGWTSAVRTDDAGVARVGAAPAVEALRVQVASPGWSNELRGTRDPEAISRGDLFTMPPQGTASIRVPITRTGSIGFRLIDTTLGRPVEGVLVGLDPIPERIAAGSRRDRPRARTDADGVVTFRDVRPGVNTIEILDRGWTFTSGASLGVPRLDPARQPRVRIKAGAHHDIRGIGVVRTASVRGRVVDELGNPLTGLRVDPDWAYHAIRTVLGRAELMLKENAVHTDGEGRFTLPGLPPGPEVVVKVVHDDHPVVRSAPIALRPGETSEEVAIVMPRGARLRLTVVDGGGAPVKGLRVAVAAGTIGRPEEWPVWKSTDGEGKLTFTCVRPGQVTWRVDRASVPPGLKPGELEGELTLPKRDLELTWRVPRK